MKCTLVYYRFVGRLSLFNVHIQHKIDVVSYSLLVPMLLWLLIVILPLFLKYFQAMNELLALLFFNIVFNPFSSVMLQ